MNTDKRAGGSQQASQRSTFESFEPARLDHRTLRLHVNCFFCETDFFLSAFIRVNLWLISLVFHIRGKKKIDAGGCEASGGVESTARRLLDPVTIGRGLISSADSNCATEGHGKAAGTGF